jgi:hypothetical protein
MNWAAGEQSPAAFFMCERAVGCSIPSRKCANIGSSPERRHWRLAALAMGPLMLLQGGRGFFLARRLISPSVAIAKKGERK